eukprot:TRINITY_DN64419_c0_g1_i1.p1 TRINITY_DN64419_c0_g1~~TRINITY_DN64419_c0_g1_i1.p1  ORF type:complete len:408 (-),score=27.83 TRINITY_DN64419_c0_g1_i1:180-1355(-)
MALQEKQVSMKCEDCKKTFYLPMACLLGGQELVGLRNRTWLKYLGWTNMSTLLQSGSLVREELKELLSSTTFSRGLALHDPGSKITLGSGQLTCRISQDANDEGYLDGEHRRCTSNLYRFVNSGRWGGLCTCPDGNVYVVGDNNDGCESLACEGGVPGTCAPHGASEHAGMKVSCDVSRAFMEASKLFFEDVGGETACWMRDGRPRFLVRNCPASHLTGVLRLPDLLSSLEHLTFWTNMIPRASDLPAFDVAYRMLYLKKAGALCRDKFGKGRLGGQLIDLVTTASPIPRDFTFMGCYLDDDERDMKVFIGYHHDARSCSSSCQGFGYFALQASGECRCGDKFGNMHYERRSDDECGVECRSGFGVLCGSGWRNAVYKVEAAKFEPYNMYF